MLKSVLFWIRATALLFLAAVFYPTIYLMGFIISIPCGVNPHKSGLKCVDKFNEVFSQ